jgi:predicted acetyltransferase
MLEIELRPARIEDKSILRNLLELYAYDFAEYDGADVDEHGLYGYHRLDHYWTDEGRSPFLVRVSGKWAGLALLREVTLPDGRPAHSIAEFFIMRKYRRLGAGKIVAQRLFDMFPGVWEVGQITENLPAQIFWRAVIADYTGGRYEEVQRDYWDGTMQVFETPDKRPEEPL